ncbi:hypothetical protein [Solimonas terrae]|uniref:EF-hand domain-containing protein n=1 Tax=Solimonas terrae TaxID=1396819 RepID=A0A6M2BKS5_9GAMM|nr:hypothetical protein [Solimonas terrae]NGY03412.1 hypothetical protein [Solimonas terrae]
MDKSRLFAVCTLAFCGAAFAQTPLPGHSMDAPGSGTVGAPEATAPADQMWVDKNGDGIIQRDEVTPGSQLAKRFDTRDANHDGQLTSDEYYLPK